MLAHGFILHRRTECSDRGFGQDRGDETDSAPDLGQVNRESLSDLLAPER